MLMIVVVEYKRRVPLPRCQPATVMIFHFEANNLVEKLLSPLIDSFPIGFGFGFGFNNKQNSKRN